MVISKAELDAFYENLQDLEEQKKAIGTEMKDAIEAFAVNNEISKKSVSKSYKDWKDANKDKAEYTQVDFEADQLILIAFPEFAPTEVV